MARSKWQDQNGKIKVARSKWQDQSDKIKMARSKWQEQSGKIKVTRSKWQDQKSCYISVMKYFGFMLLTRSIDGKKSEHDVYRALKLSARKRISYFMRCCEIVCIHNNELVCILTFSHFIVILLTFPENHPYMQTACHQQNYQSNCQKYNQRK